MENTLLISSSPSLLLHYKQYLFVKKYAQNTILAYTAVADELVCFLQDNKYYHFLQVDRNAFIKFISYLRKKFNLLSNQSINIKIAAINNFSDFLCKNYDLCNIKKIRQLKFLSKIPIIADEAELLRLLNMKNPIYNKSATWIEYRDFAIGIFIYSSGSRITEAISVSAIDLDSGWVRLEKTKNKNVRYVPINIHVHVAIANYKEQCPFFLCKNLWVCSKGKKLKSTTAAAGIKRMFGNSPHYFRHAFASHLILNGCDIRIVQEFLGHSSIATTSIYTHIKPKHLKRTIERCHPLSATFSL